MKNTLIPLDILYLDDHGTVIKSDMMQPHFGRSSCGGDVHSVLELPAGTCDELSVEVGDEITLGERDPLRDLVYESLIRE